MATDCNNKGFYPRVKGKRRKTAERLTNPDFDGNITKLCAEMNIARSTLYRWFDESDFNGYVNFLIDKYTDTELANVWRALIKKANSGSIDAIKLYFELRNKYRQGKGADEEKQQKMLEAIENAVKNGNN